MTITELEENYNSSTVSELYIDFDGDGEFDLEDDAEDGNQKSHKGKLSLDYFLPSLNGALCFSESAQTSTDYPFCCGIMIISRLYRPPNDL